MTSDRSHEAIRELLAAVALGAASAEEAAMVGAHVPGCAACRGKLEALAEAADVIGLSATTRATPDLGRVRDRLLERVAAHRRGFPAAGRPAGGIIRAWAIAATVALAVAAGWLALSLRDRATLRRSLAAQAARSTALAEQLRDSLAVSNGMLSALTGPGVTVVSLASSRAREPHGWMFWDEQNGRWTLLARDLPVLRSGRTYQLWVITRAGTRVSAGTFDPVNGRALVQATYVLPKNQLAAIAVTEEPAGGVRQPTGAIVIAGSPG